MPTDKPTDISEKTPINTNLRTVGLAVAGVAVAVWYGSNWMGNVTAKLDRHSDAIVTINSQLSELKTNQERNFDRLLMAIERKGMPVSAAASSSPKMAEPPAN